jgi:hypothetical protein
MEKKYRNKFILVIGSSMILLISLWIFGYKMSITSRQDVEKLNSRISNIQNLIKLDTSKNRLTNYELLNNDTIKVQFLQKSETKNWYESSLFSWLVPLIIGIAAAFIPLIIVYLQYRSSLYSKNMQDWIDKVRDNLGRYLTQSQLLNIQFQEKIKDKGRELILFENVYLSGNMLRLLLDSNKPIHKEVIDSMDDLEKILDDHMFIKKIPGESESKYDNYE